ERAAKCISGLRDDSPVSWSAAAADSAPASVKEAQFHIARSRNFMERAMRLEDFPGTGEHAAVFIRIRISEHDLLIAVPGIQEALVLGCCPEPAAYLGAGAKILDRFK